MKVTLNVENDAELRLYIKECIKGQVLSIVRDEFLEIVKQELERKVKASTNSNFGRMTKDALKQACSDICYKEHGVNSWREDFIKPYVEACVKEAVKNKDWKGMVDALAKEKVKSLIQ